MKSEKEKNGNYLFKVMNLHQGAGMLVEDTLWQVLPRMSANRQWELEYLEELLSLFVERMIQVADLTLLELLENTDDFVSSEQSCEDLIELFLEKAMTEVNKIHELYLEPLFLRLNKRYGRWIKQCPLTPVTASTREHADTNE